MLVIFLLGQRRAFVLASRHEYVTPGTQPSTGTPWVEYKVYTKNFKRLPPNITQVQTLTGSLFSTQDQIVYPCLGDK